MPSSVVIPALLAGVFACSLLSMYLLWLAAVHRRPAPTVLTGHRDLFYLLLGLGGFLVAAVPAATLAARSAAVALAPDDWPALKGQMGTLAAAGWAGPAVVVGLTAVVATAAWGRRDSLAVYNLRPDRLADAVRAAATVVGLEGSAAAVHVTGWSAGGSAWVRVRGLPAAAAGELLVALAARLRTGPPVNGRVGGRLTAVAAVLLGIAFGLIGAVVRVSRAI